jgi:uncharacterized membrane protein
LWSTGFIGGKLGLPFAEPITFLLVRFIAVLLILVPVAFFMKAPWPTRRIDWVHAVVAGLLLHAGYLGGVFTAIHHGMPAGIVSLIVGLQPVLTAVLAAAWFNDRVTPMQWLGLVCGFIGVVLVLSGKIFVQSWDATAFMLALIALGAITFGTLYQKRYCPNLNLLSGTVIQYSACMVLYALLASMLETMQIPWTGQFIFALDSPWRGDERDLAVLHGSPYHSDDGMVDVWRDPDGMGADRYGDLRIRRLAGSTAAKAARLNLQVEKMRKRRQFLLWFLVPRQAVINPAEHD